MIKAPTLVFLGGRDGLVGSPAAAARRARRNIIGCEVQVLPEAGHVMSVDEPVVVGERIVEFLALRGAGRDDGSKMSSHRIGQPLQLLL